MPEDPAAVVVDGGGRGRILSASPGTEVRGLTFRNGSASGVFGGGGGLVAEGPRSTVADCVFDACVAVSGGGLWAENATVQRCVFVRARR